MRTKGYFFVREIIEFFISLNISAGRSRFITSTKLEAEHVRYVIDCLKKNTTQVDNIRAYLLTALYNAPETIENYYQARVNHDMYGRA